MNKKSNIMKPSIDEILQYLSFKQNSTERITYYRGALVQWLKEETYILELF